jgi:hypothetical protein
MEVGSHDDLFNTLSCLHDDPTIIHILTILVSFLANSLNRLSILDASPKPIPSSLTLTLLALTFALYIRHAYQKRMNTYVTVHEYRKGVVSQPVEQLLFQAVVLLALNPGSCSTVLQAAEEGGVPSGRFSKPAASP